MYTTAQCYECKLMPETRDHGLTGSEITSFLPKQYETALEIGCSKDGFKGSSHPGYFRDIKNLQFGFQAGFGGK
jgi:hypothetical protein